ncbi:MAG TPA: DJ-1/PfpI family protein [Treponemataceae bacterium]|nr:DJ-1/PfpI family protein [Treponemataceae bacterium]
MHQVNVVLFDGFETLDAYGPVEIFGRIGDQFSVRFFSALGGAVSSAQGVRAITEPFSALESAGGILLVPGGAGTRALVRDAAFVSALRAFAEASEYVLTVCTGSVLFSKTGLLDGREATTNKRVFAWAPQESPSVKWVRKARWVRDGVFYTSSGVSAGMDMAYAFVSDLLGEEVARRQANEIEYFRHADPNDDPFAALYE